MVTDKDIPQQHEARLRAMCSGHLEYGQPLPEKLTKLYWSFKYVADRISAPVQDSDMIRMCVEAGFGRPTPKQLAGPSVADLWRLKKIKSGDPVVAMWDGKKQPAKLLSVNISNKVTVLVGNSPEERTIDVDQVSLPKAA